MPPTVTPPSVPQIQPTLSANELRRLAEKADGLRSENPKLVDDHGKINVVTEAQAQKDPGQRVLADINTPNTGEGLTAGASIRVVLNGTTYGDKTDLAQADAVFVTQSAIEKFLLPYYLRFKSPGEVGTIKKKLFDDKNVIAGHHLPASTYGTDKTLVVRMNPVTSALETVSIVSMD